MYTLMMRNCQTGHVWTADRSSGSVSDLRGYIRDSNLAATDYAIVCGPEIVYTETGGYLDREASLKGLRTTLGLIFAARR